MRSWRQCTDWKSRRKKDGELGVICEKSGAVCAGGAAAGGADVKLNTNENPYPPAPGVQRALAGFNPDTLRLYPEPTCKVLVDAIASYYGLGSDQVFVGVGSDDVLAMIFLTFFFRKAGFLPGHYVFFL